MSSTLHCSTVFTRDSGSFIEKIQETPFTGLFFDILIHGIVIVRIQYSILETRIVSGIFHQAGELHMGQSAMIIEYQGIPDLVL